MKNTNDGIKEYGIEVTPIELPLRPNKGGFYDPSAAAGLTITTISGVETGKINPSFRTIRALAKALGYSPQELKRLLENKV